MSGDAAPLGVRSVPNAGVRVTDKANKEAGRVVFQAMQEAHRNGITDPRGAFVVTDVVRQAFAAAAPHMAVEVDREALDAAVSRIPGWWKALDNESGTVRLVVEDVIERLGITITEAPTGDNQ